MGAHRALNMRCRRQFSGGGGIALRRAESFAALKAWLRANDIELSFSRVRPTARARLERLGLLTSERVFDTNRAAIAALSG